MSLVSPTTVVQPPTVDEWKVLQAVAAAARLHGDPTLNEIAQVMRPPVSAPTIHRALQRLVLKGWVQRLPFRSRGIRLLHSVPEENG